MNAWKQLMLVCLTSGIAMTASAQERGTREEAKAMTDAAVEHVKKVGAEKAFKDFNTDKAWRKKDLYVIAFDSKGICMAHGANERLVGKNLYENKDASGKRMTAEMLKLVTTAGSGWTDYDFVNPVTKKIEPKSTYGRKLPNFDGIVGVGVYR